MRPYERFWDTLPIHVHGNKKVTHTHTPYTGYTVLPTS